METAIKLNLQEKYCREIKGLGEVYEIMSVEHLRNKLISTYGKGFLFLCSNKSHSGRGLTLKDLKEKVILEGYKVEKEGFVDICPWNSNPIESGKRSSLIQNSLIVFIAKPLFRIVLLFEFLNRTEKKAHMVYVFALANQK